MSKKKKSLGVLVSNYWVPATWIWFRKRKMETNREEQDEGLGNETLALGGDQSNFPQKYVEGLDGLTG